MKENVLLTITSLLTILLLTFHLADDIVRGFEPGKISNLILVPIVVVWLYAVLLLAERRSGYIITLLLSLFSTVVPLIHMSGRGVGAGSRIAGTHGAFFFVWTLIAIGTTTLFAFILSVRGLWRLPRRRQR